MNLNKVKPLNPTVSVGLPNGRAADDRDRLFGGLERIVNASDRATERKELALEVYSFWPIDIEADTGLAIRWEAASWPLFIAYRNYLRRVWIGDFRKQGDDNVLLDGVYLNYLLGLDLDFTKYEPGEYVDTRLPDNAFIEGWATLKKEFPSAYVKSHPLLVPDWTSGRFFHTLANDFQKAVHALLLESWRARICRSCKRYFLANKNAQAYCSTGCSGGNKLIRGLEYWRETGSSRRAERKAKAKGKK
jgi:hypothetical protein